VRSHPGPISEPVERHACRPLALRATVAPHAEWSRGFLSVLTTILGTMMSPYLCFWQAAQEVEKEGP
jgi:Mn2+/Fe2+ NRAMP family transporter